jgi:methionine-rich copper-binding protein CopC
MRTMRRQSIPYPTVGKTAVFRHIRHLVALLFVASLGAFPSVAQGHAFPDHSDPKVGSTLTVSPAQVRIWFDSALEPAFSTIMVHNANNEMVDKKDGRVDPSNPTLLQVSLPRLSPGLYLVMWNVVSRDGHRTTGDFTFTIK